MITQEDINQATMWVNGYDVYNDGVLVESFSVKGTPVENDTYQGANSTSFNLLHSGFGMKEITVNLFFTAKDRRHITLKKSHIDSLFYGKLELRLPDGFYYTSVLNAAGELSILGVENNEVIALCSYSFEGIQHDPLVTHQGNTIHCESTMPLTNCRLTCNASRAYTSLQIGSVTITGVSSGDTLVVDGITGRILQNGALCAGNMSFLRFPQLTPGQNTISCPETLTIEYYPTYI